MPLTRYAATPVGATVKLIGLSSSAPDLFARFFAALIITFNKKLLPVPAFPLIKWKNLFSSRSKLILSTKSSNISLCCSFSLLIISRYSSSSIKSEPALKLSRVFLASAFNFFSKSSISSSAVVSSSIYGDSSSSNSSTSSSLSFSV